MLHHVLCTLREFIPELRLAQVQEIKLLCIIGYADDLMIICKNEEDVERIITILEPLLASIRLEINSQ